MTYAKQVANEVSEAMDADGYLVDEVIKAVEAVIERCAQEAEHAWDPRRPEVTARAIRALAASPALQPAPVACPTGCEVHSACRATNEMTRLGRWVMTGAVPPFPAGYPPPVPPQSAPVATHIDLTCQHGNPGIECRWPGHPENAHLRSHPACPSEFRAAAPRCHTSNGLRMVSGASAGTTTSPTFTTSGPPGHGETMNTRLNPPPPRSPRPWRPTRHDWHPHETMTPLAHVTHSPWPPPPG